jgi:hypothetical protein
MHTKKLSVAEAMQELQSAKHTNSSETAGAMLKQYKRFRNQLMGAKKEGHLPQNIPSFPICLSFNKLAIFKLMKAPGCSGIRIYPAINNKHQLTLVIVAVDENGENILPLSAQQSATC